VNVSLNFRLAAFHKTRNLRIGHYKVECRTNCF